MAPTLSPLRFEPTFKSALWGADVSPTFFGAPKTGPISEAWLLSDVDDNVSVVADGPWRGTTLRELMQSHRAQLLGPKLAHHKVFPLLFKYIDAREPLSVQVHPNDEQALHLANQMRGKSEAWIVRHVEPGSRIFAGLRDHVSRDEFQRALGHESVSECLHSFEPQEGDCVFLPAGTVHAAGGGIVVFEVQQASDITFRLFDWHRIDPKIGKPRELHVDHALQCVDFLSGPVFPIKLHSSSVVEPFVKCPYFELRRITANVSMRLGFEVAHVLTAVAGGGEIVCVRNDEVTPLTADHPVLVPPGEYLVQPDSELTWIECKLV